MLARIDGLRARRVESIEERAQVELGLLAEVAEIIRRYGASAVTDQ
jgi:hypothetical protein